VKRGEFLLIAGPSGCGKTTLCRTLNGLIPHFYSGGFSGRVLVEGHDVAESSMFQLAQIVGFVFQNPDNQIVMTTVERDVAFGLENLGLSREEITERVSWALSLLDLQDISGEAIHNLSGGQKQKLAVAGAIAMKPSVLVLDEPTAYFSPASAANFFYLLEGLRRELGLTIVMVEHRLDLASRYASRIAIMEEGRILFLDEPRRVFERDTSELTSINIPSLVKVYHRLKDRGMNMSVLPLTPEEFKASLLESRR
jgi:energy-coupling factor transporter ATP-binding protein EcfA2